ncbi:MAG: gamma-glutamyl-gamma-aminobutyrate hydrolase family protein [Candidatus Melainabacteria bacterium]|nr:MAG: gamma-glutamyl-gamma-aminobutyrate hydrolase family protein [Candidatus Melainabacteria bacterium]
MKPVIGINVDVTAGPPEEARVQALYFDAVRLAGGVPLLVPPMPDEDLKIALERLDGLMFIGGYDYCPSKYGEALDDDTKKKLNVELAHERRQDFDFKLIRLALEKQAMPILGICAGEQLLNVELGGTLVTDIVHEHPDSNVLHASKNGWQDGFKRHEVILEEKSALAGIYKKLRIDVPTSHHQAVDKPGRGLSIAARAEDGIIEAVELEGRKFVIGVQWHPERDFEGNRSLFETFVQHCSAPVAHGR